MPRFKVAYSPESLQEIKRIVDHYNALSKGLGARFKKNLLAEIVLIKQNPFTRSFYAVVGVFFHQPPICSLIAVMREKTPIINSRLIKQGG